MAQTQDPGARGPRNTSRQLESVDSIATMADDAAKKAPPAKKSLPSELIMSAPVWKSTSVFGASRRRVDGVEDDAAIQHERAVKF